MSSSSTSPSSSKGGGVIPVKVAVRIRPLNAKEIEEGCQAVVQVVPNRPQIFLTSLEKAFTYDYAYKDAVDQKTIFETSVSPMIHKLFEGYNATVLAYGQTGSGKTYSMGTSCRLDKTPPEETGIIPRAVTDIFQEISRKRSELDVAIRVSFVELYREQLYDLLSPGSHKKEDCICDLREDPVKGVIIPNLTETAVSSLEETMEQLEIGSVKRVTAATAMNNTSSRSHAIFTLQLTMTKKDDLSNVTVSKFHLVDLAGSERSKKTKTTGDRQKEGISINQGLLALGNVIAALGEEIPPGKTANHIPYRNSKLTRLLQDSLGGNSYTLMVSCVSPADSNVEETLSTLRYSDRARKIKNKPIVNVDGKDAELNRLRLENQDLKLQLAVARGGNLGCGSGGGGGVFRDRGGAEEETNVLRESGKRLREENKELTVALMACQEELTHMNEKLILHEGASETFKAKLKQLVAEMGAIDGDKNRRRTEDLLAVERKIRDLVDAVNDAEKTIVDHDISRADVSNVAGADCGKDNTFDDEEERFAAAHALKQNALANQLSNLNKLLAQKEQLASAMGVNDEKLQEMKNSYEKSLETLQSEIAAVQKEREELSQQQRNAASDPTCKIAEQRRKRIQELEHKMQELTRKVMEQQRAIKMNEKNEAQVKKLAEEILSMKQAKVKLICQIKKDAEKQRIFKQTKEKEVMKLKQTERKQQVKIVQMENLHSKQQNVMRRKMEEAVNVNKRLKDILEKQKASKFNSGQGGLAGAGEKVRNWINEEMDVVVSVKEAVQSRLQLIKDRTVLTKELNYIKRGLRDTLSGEEMAENKKKMEGLQSELDMRNAQISQLQKQISDSEQDGTTKRRFENFKSMLEAKIALEHLFEKSVEQAVYNSQMKSEFDELGLLYDESVRNINTLEKEIANLKNEHQTESMKNSRQHEEKVLFLLSKLSNASESERWKIHEDEIQQYSKLNEELQKISTENEKLREKMLQEDKPVSPEKKKKKTSNKLTEGRRYGVSSQGSASFVDSDMSLSDSAVEDSADESAGDDPDWEKTPLFKRITKLRRETGASTLTVPGQKKRKAAAPPLGNMGPSMDEAASTGDEDDPQQPPAKRFSGTGCKCKSDCRSKRCPCKKSGPVCAAGCLCDTAMCRNRPDRSVLSDASNNDTANTMSLLNDSYSSTSVMMQSPPNRDANKTYFKSPIEEEVPKGMMRL